MKRMISALLCTVLCISCFSGFKAAAFMDENELPGVVVDPDLVLKTLELRVSVPDSWQEVYAYVQSPELLGEFPGMALSKQGIIYTEKLPVTATKLILNDPGSNQQTDQITLTDTDHDVVISVKEDATCQVYYGTFGDVTGDGKMNIGDAAKIYSHLRGSNPLTNEGILAFADATGDGRVNMGDVAKIYGQIRTIVPNA